jgi:hypothetical protein
MADEASEKPADDESTAPASEPVGEETPANAPESETGGAGESGADALPPKRKKKKRKKPAPEADVPELPKEIPLDDNGRERPLFVLGFPSDPELDRLVRAFELGNYAYVREHAPKLAERAESERVREAARELARRIEPDPLIKILLLLSVLLLAALTIWAYKTHGQ